MVDKLNCDLIITRLFYCPSVARLWVPRASPRREFQASEVFDGKETSMTSLADRQTDTTDRQTN